MRGPSVSFFSLLGGAVLLALVGSAGTATASCESNPECNPYDPTTIGCCNPSDCTWRSNGASCEDGNDCTSGTTCNGSHKCVNNAVYSGATLCRERTIGYVPKNCKKGTCNSTTLECNMTGVTDLCTDNNACTTDCDDVTAVCYATPVTKPAGTTCEGDSSLCTIEECNSNADCVHVDDVVCPDTSPPQCKIDQCQPSTGACNTVSVPNSPETACTADSNQCTKDICVNGSCSHPADTGASCNDLNVCTDPDTCNASKDCVGTPKNPGTACTTDNNPCTYDICTGTTPETAACTHSPLNSITQENTQGMACNDGWSCSFGTTCDQGDCAGSGRFCDGSKPCLACQNSCNPTAPEPQCGCTQ